MNLSATIKAAVQVLTLISKLTKTTLDDQLLTLIVALDQSPVFVSALQSILVSIINSGVPSSAMPELHFDNAALATAFNESAALQEWSAAQKPSNVPENAEALGLGGIGTVVTVIKLLPQLLSGLRELNKILEAWKAAQPAA